jgi:(p)ppGpp synthase/HD superfamily hydrolase
MKQSEIAEQIAREAHEGQMRRDQVTPYIVHPEEVAQRVAPHGDDAVAIAWLHDVLEDTPLEYKDLVSRGISIDNAMAVTFLSKEEGSPYVEYIRRIIRFSESNRILGMVKLADIISNLNDDPAEFQRKRYAWAIAAFLGLEV